MYAVGGQIAYVAALDREHFVAGLEAGAGAAHRRFDPADPKAARGLFLAKNGPDRADGGAAAGGDSGEQQSQCQGAPGARAKVRAGR